MTPHKQTIKHDPKNGEYGDCYRTCFAMIFDLDPQDVPHFVNGKLTNAEVSENLKAWLDPQGYNTFSLFFPSSVTLDQIVETMTIYNKDTPVMISGQSPRGEWNHVVICHNGVIHDPAISESVVPLAGPCLPDGNWWIEVVTKSTCP